VLGRIPRCGWVLRVLPQLLLILLVGLPLRRFLHLLQPSRLALPTILQRSRYHRLGMATGSLLVLGRLLDGPFDLRRASRNAAVGPVDSSAKPPSPLLLLRVFHQLDVAVVVFLFSNQSQSSLWRLWFAPFVLLTFS